MAEVDSSGKRTWGVSYEYLSQKQYLASEDAQLYNNCMIVLQSTIDSYNTFKQFLLNNYAYTFGYLQDYLTTAKDNFENGYQSGVDNFSSEIDSIIGAGGDGGIVEEYKTAVENILNQVDPKIGEFTAAKSDAKAKYDQAVRDYNYYTGKINRHEYDSDYE